MGKKLVTRTAKVLSETKKSKDKEAVAIAYEHIPRNPEEQQHGSLYAVIELEDSSGHAEEIAEKIIDILHEEYYSNTEEEPLTAFENALAKINDELTDRSSEGQINWLGKLNAVLAVLSGGTLHVTQSGKAEAFLYRGEHTMHITEDLAGDAINPQRTFINIASGDLTETDRVVLLTPGVFYKLSKQELKKYTTENSPKNASENISKLLTSENGATKPNALLLMEMVSPESFVADEESEEKTEVWVKEEGHKAEEIGEGVAAGAAKTFDVIGKAFAGASTFVSTKAVPFVKESTGKATQKIKSFRKDPEAEEVIIASEEKIHELSNQQDDIEIDSDDGILENPQDQKTEIRIKETKKKPKLISLERFDFSFLERAKDAALTGSKRLRLPGGKYFFAYLAVGVVLIIGLFSYMAFARNNSQNRAAAENMYNQANSLYSESLDYITAGNYQDANSNLTTAEDLATDVLETEYFNQEASDLLAKIANTKDEAQRITRNSASVFYEFENPVTNIYQNGELFYGINFADGATYSLDPKAGTVATITEPGSVADGIINATLVADRNVLVAYTKNAKVYEIDLDDGQVSEQSVAGDTWESSVSVGSFGTNIYLLSPAEGQIFKHFKLTSGYGRKQDYFNSPANLSGVVDMAIDGAIYVTDSSGAVQKFTSGVRDDYTLSGLPLKYEDVKGIYAHPEVSGIYLFTNELIIKIDEDGNFVAQYANDGVSSIGNIFVQEDDKTLYFAAGNKVYSLGY